MTPVFILPEILPPEAQAQARMGLQNMTRRAPHGPIWGI